MRKTLLVLSILLTLPLISVLAQNNASQKKAHRILKELSQKYKKYKTVEAHFSFTLNNAQDHINEVQTGVLYAEPSTNRYHLQLNGQEIFSDGKSTYTYLKAQKEIQVANIDTNSESINPAHIFSIYENGFNAQYRNETQQGKMKLDQIDLVPQHVKKILKAQLSVIKHPRQLYQVRLFDKNGNQYVYTVNQFIANPKINSDLFTYSKKIYPGVELIDLR